MTTEKILDKLAKLKASRDGEAAIGNSAAAEAFAEAINRLLIQHELSESEIPVPGVAEEPIIEMLFDFNDFRDERRDGFKFTNKRIGWQEALARIVAKAHLCKFLVTRNTNYITFVGTRPHCVAACYAYGVLASTAARLSSEARNEHWRLHSDEPDFSSGNYRASWLLGFVERIDERFREALRKEVHASGMSTSTALMKLDGALVRAQAYVDDKYKKKPIPSASLSTGLWSARREGRAAADQMKLGQKGVEAGGSRKLIK